MDTVSAQPWKGQSTAGTGNKGHLHLWLPISLGAGEQPFCSEDLGASGRWKVCVPVGVAQLWCPPASDRTAGLCQESFILRHLK